jgi:hypothetical protein
MSRLRDRSRLLRQAHPGSRVGLDVAGLVLGGGCAVVAAVVAGRTGTDALPLVGLLSVAVATVAGAFAVGARTRRAFVAIGVAAWAAWILWRWRGTILTGPLNGPFGYRNAAGAFLSLGAVAALMAAASLRRWWWVVLGVATAIGLGTAAVAASAASMAPLALSPLALLALGGRRGARVAIAICGLAFVTVLASTVWLGVTRDPGSAPTGIAARIADAGLTQRRLDLWHDALTILRHHPDGIGLGRFHEVSPTALSDADAMYAHNQFLEQGAELGWAGLVLLTGLFAWGLLRLWMVPSADVVTALAAAAVAGLGIHASVDYVLRTPDVVVAVAALLGTGMVARARSQL